MRGLLGFFLGVVLFASCSSKENKRPSIYEGKINVGMDESIMKVISASTDAYTMHYPKAGFNHFVMPENTAVRLLLKDSLDVICITRLFTEEEMAVLEKRKIKYRPAPMALDAVVLIAHPESPVSNYSMEELKELFTADGEGPKLVFDSGNSSNLNQVMGKLGISDFNKDRVVSAGGNIKVFDWVKKDKNAIGFVGYNMISEKTNEATRDLKSSVKILKVGGVEPVKRSILDQTYAFQRIIYLHTLGSAWGVNNGFIRFACTKPGQLIAEKMGLVPYYAIPKEFYISKEEL
jgi:phosphate transport system substrate-binding protein